MADTLLYGAFLCTASLVAYRPDLVYSRDYPVHIPVTGLLITAALLFLTSKYVRNRRPGAGAGYDAKIGYDQLPQEERNGAVEKLPARMKHSPLRKPLRLLLIPAATLALCARIELTRRMQANSACYTYNAAGWTPFLVAVYDALRFQVRREADDEALPPPPWPPFINSRWRFLPAVAQLPAACFALTTYWITSQSTYICPVASHRYSHTSNLQLLAFILDAALAIAAFELSLGSHASEPLSSWCLVTGGGALMWASIGMMVYISQPEHGPWLMLREISFLALLGKSLTLAICCCLILFSISTFGVLHITVALASLLTVIPGLIFIWSSREPFPPATSIPLACCVVYICLLWIWFRQLEQSRTTTERRLLLLRRILTGATLAILIFPALRRTNTVHIHPIGVLMQNAQKQSVDYINVAARSKNLLDAVHNYRDRYGDSPPPGFDVWFQYAMNRSVQITDEFDQIYEDLLPFRAISPADLRKQTWEMVSNPWNEISGITIRNGRADVQANVLPTHRWMLEGVANLINSFAQYLPDMDLAFNLNDESRVAMKYDELMRHRDVATLTPLDGKTTFSTDRSNGWLPIPTEPTTDSILENWSGHNTFREWGLAGCPPSSAARSRTPPLSDSQVCLECALPHSMGQFLANWSLAADPCHQPDLAQLHGFYTSPAAFKATHQLRPIFSQSKAVGYNDILYPSAWNYMDKVAYSPRDAAGTPGEEGYRPAFPDPPFSEKRNVLYWRGATSEGLSPGTGTWRGMVRQRLVHMANNYTSSPHDSVTILLPNSRHPETYTYTTFPGIATKALRLDVDMRFVDIIHRCGGGDCAVQEVEFQPSLVPSSDFQSHWQYRFLFDADGAGFSGRFLPFLQSRSLPFKTALFRQWYESRLTPWLHFVPQDLRLHGLWSTLAYLGGVDGVDHNGRKVQWNAHAREAETIAEAGREWAGKVLRKEDMEVYFFRLLLEWARLTDDRRDELGCAVNA